MKRKIGYALALVCVMAFGAIADSMTYTLTTTPNNTNLSDAVSVSGWLDKIEVSGDGVLTNIVTIGTYAGSAGTTIIDTFACVTNTTFSIIRPRVLPTDSSGTAYTALQNATYTNETTTMLNVNYEKILIGGNVKVKIANAATATNNVKVVFYYEPLKR